MDEIIRDPTPAALGEEHLAALTAGERTLWAEARETYFRGGVNRSSLEAIEKAAFVLILDDEDFEIGIVSSIELIIFLEKMLFLSKIDSLKLNFLSHGHPKTKG